MFKTNHDAEPPPKCFGDPKLYDPNVPECAGGHDPAHFNQNPNSPNFRTNIRDTCDWIQACGGRVQAGKHNLIPTHNLVRPQQPPTSPYATKFNQPTTPPTQGWRPPSSYTPTHSQQPPGNHLMAMHFGIPQYLSVREPHTGGFGQRLVRESFRSMLKSIGHTFAHFFDVEIFGTPPNDGGGPPGG